MDQEIFGELLEDPEPWPDAIYGAAVNLAGLYSNVPVLCYWDDKTQAWLDEEHMFEITKLGLEKNAGRVSFASAHKDEVETWILGVRSTMLLLRNWTSFDCQECSKHVFEEGSNFCIFCKATLEQGELILENKEIRKAG